MIRKQISNFTKGINKKHIYTGLQHAITATGGFSIESNIKPMHINVIQNIAKYDVTDSVQILFDVDTINAKLGLYDTNKEIFEMDSVMICAEEFIVGLKSVEQIISVGKLENLYKNFVTYVNTFLNYEEGFSSIYLMDEKFEIEKEKMDTLDLYETLIRQTENIYGIYNDLYGNVTINGTNKLLKNMQKLNLFGNREGISQTGFIENDLIYIPYGLTFNLRVDLDAENLELNKLGLENIEKMNAKSDYDTGTGSQQTITNTDKIIRIVKIPLLIKLTNIPKPIIPIYEIEPTITTEIIEPISKSEPVIIESTHIKETTESATVITNAPETTETTIIEAPETTDKPDEIISVSTKEKIIPASEIEKLFNDKKINENNAYEEILINSTQYKEKPPQKLQQQPQVKKLQDPPKSLKNAYNNQLKIIKKDVTNIFNTNKK